MSTAGRAPARSFFLPGAAGDLFALYHPPSAERPRPHDVLIVPPLAEEMNKSRRMLALLARALADAGIGALVLDLYGTGDSAGEFAEARWETWKADVGIACAWLRERGGSVSLVGVRLGALLAADVVREDRDGIGRLVFWQPVLSGESALTQFLRMRVAAAALEGGERQSTAGLRRELERGTAVEIAGYELGPALARAIDGLRLESMVQPDFPPIHWLELVAEEGRECAPASRRVTGSWRTRGVRVNMCPVVGPPFWSSAEIAVAPALLHATVAALASEQ